MPEVSFTVAPMIGLAVSSMTVPVIIFLACKLKHRHSMQKMNAVFPIHNKVVLLIYNKVEVVFGSFSLFNLWFVIL